MQTKLELTAKAVSLPDERPSSESSTPTLNISVGEIMVSMPDRTVFLTHAPGVFDYGLRTNFTNLMAVTGMSEEQLQEALGLEPLYPRPEQVS